MDDVQKLNNCTNISSSQTFTSSKHNLWNLVCMKWAGYVNDARHYTCVLETNIYRCGLTSRLPPFSSATTNICGMRYRSWLRHYATSRKVTGPNPDEVFFFNLPNPSCHTKALGSTQPLTEMTTRNLPGE
jgi:hypothetical protein